LRRKLKPNGLTNKHLEYLLALADKYDQSGQYHLADKVFTYLKQWFNDLPQEVKLRIQQGPHFGAESMTSTEQTRGYDAVRIGPPAYTSGKGQQAYRDNLPMNKEFF
jgi:hypothetical protein